MAMPVPTPQITRNTAHSAVGVLKLNIRNKPDPIVPTAVPTMMNGSCNFELIV